MKFQTVTSSFIDKVGFDAATGEMVVYFANGNSEKHTGITSAKHSALVNAESVGSHYNKNYRGAAGKKPKIVQKNALSK